MTTVIYIEGTADTDNGNLRKAFSKLFEKELQAKMPKIKMGDGRSQTIDKFHSTPLGEDEIRFLLVDSDRSLDDNTDNYKDVLLKSFNEIKPNRKISCDKGNSFFMIQEAESWILSQPIVLEKAKIDIKKLVGKNVKLIQKPSKFLADLYKNSRKQYHKVSEFSKVFVSLDSNQLKKDFTDYKELIEAINK